MIDLYSDTLTKPTPDMRRFMCEAEVGDEQKGEDPTVNLLQEMVADLLGKEAAVFLPSGTMCNEIAVKVHTRPGDEVLADRTSHLIHFEGGGSGLGRLVAHQIPAGGASVPHRLRHGGRYRRFARALAQDRRRRWLQYSLDYPSARLC